MPAFQDAFISYARKDSQPFAERLKSRLEQADLAIWLDQQNIPAASDWRDRIRDGIENAHNFIYIISPGSVGSKYCQEELTLALGLNKRIVPLLHVSTELKTIPDEVSAIQRIPFQDNLDDFETSIQVLRAALQEDSGYLHQHTALLTQALKWERNERRPAMLLRGHNLRYAENWLKIAQARALQRPTDLQAEFIAISREQPPEPALDVFISYSQKDAADFARRLNAQLQLQGQHTWFDQESIAPEADFQQEIYQGIEGSGVFLFVLSPEAVNSPHCADEVNHASSLNKRMVMVLHRQVNAVNLHPALKNPQWIDFSCGNFDDNFQRLFTTLNDSPQHSHQHTRLLVRSGEWDRRGRDESLLLRGQDLQTAETWLATNAEVDPLPTGFQQEYIRAGRARQEAEEAAEKKLRRGALIGAIAAIAGISVAAVSGGVAWYLQGEALKSMSEAKWDEALATNGERIANRKTFYAEILAGNSVKEADQAQQDQLEAEAKAQDAETRANEADGKAQTAAVAQQQAEASAQAADVKAQKAEDRARDADIKTADAEKAQRLAQTGTRLEQAGTFALNRFEFNQIDALLRAIKTGHELQTAMAEAGIPIKAVSKYPAASPILALQQLQAKSPNSLLAHQREVTSASFNATGDAVVTASNDGTARVWDLKTGQSTPLEGHTDAVISASFNATGDQVVTASWDDTAQVWDLKTGQSTPLEGHTAYVNSATFSPEGDRVVTASSDGTARVWDLQGRQLAIYEGDAGVLSPVRAASPEGNGQRIAAVVDGRVQVYDIEPLPELITWGCQWLHNYLEYGQATDADRAICNLPPRDSAPTGPFESSLGRTLGLVAVSWPEQG